MTERDPTYIGRVRQVFGAQVTVALDPGLAGVAPIYKSQLHPIGQIGSLVRIPQGSVDIFATVSEVRIAEPAGTRSPTRAARTGERWLQVQLLGQADRYGGFQRGIRSYPGLDDPVHFATAGNLNKVFPPEGEDGVRLGSLAAAQDVSVCVKRQELVLRHTAVVGSTGAGKTTAVASMVQRLAERWWGAKIVVIDPHDEYGNAFPTHSQLSVTRTGKQPLIVPYWALPAAAVLRAFAGAPVPEVTAHRAEKFIREGRQEYVKCAKDRNLDPDAVTADTPVPFSIRTVWFELDCDNRRTTEPNEEGDTVDAVEREKEGNASTLKPKGFKPYGRGNAPPNKGDLFGKHGRVPDRLRLGLQDPRLRFLISEKCRGKDIQEDELANSEDDLANMVKAWLGGPNRVSVLDFSGVSDRAAEIAVGGMLDILFELAIHADKDDKDDKSKHIGRSRPVLIVLEEAHRYLNESADPMARAAVNRIAREGRKYGIGLMLVTQRPAELPDTALAQCGTLVALRLSNSADQGKLRVALPDTVAGLAEALPALSTGEAIISGEALDLPVRARLDRPNPPPEGRDPEIRPSTLGPDEPEIDPTDQIERWRETYGSAQLAEP